MSFQKISGAPLLPVNFPLVNVGTSCKKFESLRVNMLETLKLLQILIQIKELSMCGLQIALVHIHCLYT
jgi:hypothetical protein